MAPWKPITGIPDSCLGHVATISCVVMALVRSISAWLAQGKQRRREAPDIWKLYHYLHFYRQALEAPKRYGAEIGEVGKVIEFEQPLKKLSVKKQYEQVHLAVTEQVRLRLWGQSWGHNIHHY